MASNTGSHISQTEDEQDYELPAAVRSQITSAVARWTDQAVQELRLATSGWPSVPGEDDDQNIRATIDRLRTEAESANNEQAAYLHHEVARLYEQHLDDNRSALKAAISALRKSAASPVIRQTAVRLMVEIGSGPMLGKLIEDTVGQLDAAAQRIALLLDFALYQEIKLGNSDEAIETYQWVLKEDATNAEAIEGLFRLLLRSENWDELAHVCKQAADHEQDGATRASLLLASALLASEASDTDRAARVAQALESNRQSDLIVPLAVGLFRAANDSDGAIRVLVDQAEKAPENAAQLYFQASWLTAYELKRLGDAIQYAEKSVEAKPDSPLFLNWLAELYRRDARWSDMVEVLQKKGTLDRDPGEAVETLLVTAEILVNRLNKADDAIQILEVALEKDPSDPGCLQSLGSLYAQKERWKDLVAMHLKEASAVKDEDLKASAKYRAARILSEKLNEHESAIEAAEQCLELRPKFLPGRRLLEGLYRRERKFDKLADMYRTELNTATEEARHVAILERLATLLDLQLNDTKAAISAYEDLLELQASNPLALRALPRLYQTTNQHKDLLSVLRAQVMSAREPLEKAAILVQMGQAIEEHLDDKEQALAHYREALDTYPSVDVYEQVGRLLHETKRWSDLLSLYKQQLELSEEDAERANILYRIGRLHEQHFEDIEASANAYREALDVDPTYRPALRGALRAAQQLPDLKGVKLENLLAKENGSHHSGEDIRIALNLLKQQPDDARTILQRASSTNGSSGLAHNLLLQTWAESAHWDDVVKHVGTLDAVPIATAGIRKPNQALELTKQAVKADPNSLAAMRWLEVLQAAVGEPDELAEVLKKRSDREANEDRKHATLLRLAYLSLERDSEAFDAASICRQILDTAPHDVRALDLLERVAARSKDPGTLIEVTERREKQITNDRDRAWLQAARAHLLQRSDETEKAIPLWRQALETDSACRPAYEALKTHYWTQKDNEGMRWTLSKGLDAVHDEQTQVLDLLQRADLAFDAEEEESALADVERVLEIDPAQPNALDRLIKLLAKQGDSKTLAARVRRAAEHASSPDRRTALYLRLGLIFRDQLDDLEQATEAFADAIKADPENVSALLANADVQVQLDQPTEAVVLLNQATLRSAEKDNENDYKVAHLALAHICHRVLGDPQRARKSLSSVLEIDPDELQALHHMSEIAEELGSDDRLEECLVRLKELEEAPDRRATVFSKLGSLLYRREGTSTRTIDALVQAHELAPGDIPLLHRIVEVFSAAEVPNECKNLADTLKSSLDHIPDGQRTPFLLKLGQVLSQELGKPDDARQYLREAVKRDPNQDGAVELLLEHLDQSALEDPELRREAINLHRSLLNNDPLLVSSIRGLANLCSAEERTDEAFCAQAVLMLLGEANEEETYFFKKLRRNQPAKPAGTLSEAQLLEVALPDGDHPLREMLALLNPHLSTLEPPDFTQYGITSLDGSALAEDHPLHKIAEECASVLGIESFQAVEAFGGAAGGTTELASTPILVLPGDMTRYPVPEQRFLIGRLMTRIALSTEAFEPGRADPMSARSLEQLLAAVLRSQDGEFGADVAPTRILDDMIDDLKKRLDASQLERAQKLADVCWWQEPHRERMREWLTSCNPGCYAGRCPMLWQCG